MPDLIHIDITTAMTGEQLATLTKEMQSQVLSMAINAAHAEMTRLAQSALHTTMGTYINGLQQPQIMGMEASIALVGALPNAIENGQAAYDMHNTLLGPNVPVVKRGEGKGKHARKGGGYYRAIPFRQATPGTVGAVGAAMGTQYSGHAAVQDAAALGASVYAAAKKLKPSKLDPNRPGKTSYGGRLPAGLAPKLKPHHQTDIFAGMIKQAKQYRVATQSSFVTFRTISSGSPGWMRRETQGVHFFSKTADMIRAILPTMIANALK